MWLMQLFCWLHPLTSIKLLIRVSPIFLWDNFAWLSQTTHPSKILHRHPSCISKVILARILTSTNGAPSTGIVDGLKSLIEILHTLGIAAALTHIHLVAYLAIWDSPCRALLHVCDALIQLLGLLRCDSSLLIWHLSLSDYLCLFSSLFLSIALPWAFDSASCARWHSVHLRILSTGAHILLRLPSFSLWRTLSILGTRVRLDAHLLFDMLMALLSHYFSPARPTVAPNRCATGVIALSILLRHGLLCQGRNDWLLSSRWYAWSVWSWRRVIHLLVLRGSSSPRSHGFTSSSLIWHMPLDLRHVCIWLNSLIRLWWSLIR